MAYFTGLAVTVLGPIGVLAGGEVPVAPGEAPEVGAALPAAARRAASMNWSWSAMIVVI